MRTLAASDLSPRRSPSSACGDSSTCPGPALPQNHEISTKTGSRPDHPPPSPPSVEAPLDPEIPVPADMEPERPLAGEHFKRRQKVVPKPRPAFLRSVIDTLNLPPAVLLASLFLNLLGLALPLAMLQIYDRIIPNEALNTLTLLCLGLLGAFLLEATLKILRAYILGWATVQHGFRKQLDAAARLVTTPPEQIRDATAGDWMDGFDALGELNGFYGGNSRLILIDLPMAAIFLFMISFIGGALALVPITLIAIFGVFTILRGRLLHEVLIKRTEQDHKRYDFLVECLFGHPYDQEPSYGAPHDAPFRTASSGLRAGEL